MRLSVDGVEDAIAELDDVATRMRDLSPVLEVAASDTRTLIDDSFQNSRSPDDSAWATHSDVTLMLRARRAAGPNRTRSGRVRAWTRQRSERAARAVFNAKPLIDRGRLRASIRSTSTRSSLKFGTNVIYAGPQQFGNPNNRLFNKRRAPIPARPFLPIEGEGGRFGLMTGGRAGVHWRQVVDDVAHYIRTGEIRP